MPPYANRLLTNVELLQELRFSLRKPCTGA
jgi:hypothetical protein